MRIDKQEEKVDRTHNELMDKTTKKVSVKTVQESLEKTVKFEKDLNKSTKKSCKNDLIKAYRRG